MAVAVEKGFAVCTLFLFSDALVNHLRRQAGVQVDELTGDPLLQVVWFAVYAITLGLIASRYRSFVRSLLADKWLLALVAVAVFSIIWSPEPMVTVRRCVGLIGTTGFGLYLASRYEFDEWLGIVGTAMVVVAVMSLAFVVLIPSYGVHQEGVHAGLWRGVFTTKNHLGRIMVLGAITFAALTFGRKGSRWWALALIMALALLIKAGSMTAAVALLCAAGVFVLGRTFNLHTSLLLPMLTVVVAASVVGITWTAANMYSIAELLGRDLALTGRVPLWIAVLERIAERPLLGYGFGTFWIGTPETSGPVWSVTQVLNGWRPVSAHSGFLDLLLAAGVVGGVCFFASFGIAVLRAVRFQRVRRRGIDTWALMFLVLLVVMNLGESSLFRQNNIYWALTVALATTLALASKRWRRMGHRVVAEAKMGRLRDVGCGTRGSSEQVGVG